MASSVVAFQLGMVQANLLQGVAQAQQDWRLPPFDDGATHVTAADPT